MSRLGRGHDQPTSAHRLGEGFRFGESDWRSLCAAVGEDAARQVEVQVDADRRRERLLAQRLEWLQPRARRCLALWEELGPLMVELASGTGAGGGIGIAGHGEGFRDTWSGMGQFAAQLEDRLRHPGHRTEDEGRLELALRVAMILQRHGLPVRPSRLPVVSDDRDRLGRGDRPAKVRPWIFAYVLSVVWAAVFDAAETRTYVERACKALDQPRPATPHGLHPLTLQVLEARKLARKPPKNS